MKLLVDGPLDVVVFACDCLLADILERNEKITLALFWSLILRYQIVKKEIDDPSADSGGAVFPFVVPAEWSVNSSLIYWFGR